LPVIVQPASINKIYRSEKHHSPELLLENVTRSSPLTSHQQQSIPYHHR
jgi:hypothetical protein